MFKVRMGRLSLGACFGMCVVTAFIWAAWTQTRSSQNTSSDPNASGIVLPTGYLPTMPYPALKGAMVDLSAERLTSFDGPSSSADLEFDSRNYALLIPDSGLEKNSISSGTRNSAAGNDPLRKLMMQAQRSAAPSQELLQSASVLYGSSFRSLFSSAFKKPEELSSEEKEAANPFTEAKQDTDKASSAIKESSSKSAKPQSAAKATNGASPQQDVNAVSQGGSPLPPVLFLGDWDGSGVLKANSASRIDDSNFLFPDGQRSFNFYINPSAVEQQRSLAMEDINGDGIADLLVTGRDSLFGAVLLGDATGGFHVFDSFLTGYEPVLPVLGPYVNGLRKVVTLDTRSGEVVWFSFSGGHFNAESRKFLAFEPDYAGHLLDTTLGADYLMIGNIDQPPGSYQILSDDTLKQTAGVLPFAPSTDMYQNFPGTGNWRLRCFQVGSFASIVLTKETGETFNVANLRVMPGVFIAIGDLNNDGTVDVAVARPK